MNPLRIARATTAPLLLALAMTALAMTGCKTAPSTPDTLAYTPSAQAAQEAGWPLWLAGDEDAALGATQSIADEDLATETLFLQAEFDFWAGDVERALHRYLLTLTRQPAHPLARFAAARVHDLFDDTVDYDQRVLASLKDLKFQTVHPITAAYLSMIGQRLAQRDWSVRQEATPLDVATHGLPQRWQTSPRLSILRLTDLTTPFPPESQTQLSPSYISPSVAQDVPVNQQLSRPYIASGINLTPDLGAEGIYYLETFATVTADSPQVYWLHANFAGGARLWIDGQEVLTRHEDDYTPGKLMRRIKLSPGTHRVLLKLANQPNYRDWFDLTFIHPEATLLGGSLMTFGETRDDQAAQGTVELLSPQRRPTDIEPIFVEAARVKAADDVSLYLTALAAHYDRDAPRFDAAYQELAGRHPQLAALPGLKSLQLQTLWELPGKLRDAAALSELRRAYELHPTSLQFLSRLSDALKSRGEDRELQLLLEAARDGAFAPAASTDEQKTRLRHIGPLNAWANYLGDKGWDEAALLAWRSALDASPTNCEAARGLQRALYERGDYLTPDKITPRASQCPALEDAWIAAQPEAYAEKLASAARQAARYPYSDSAQLTHVKLLDAAGEPEEATRQLEAAAARIPWSINILAHQSDRELLAGKPEAALRRLDAYTQRYGPSAWLTWQLATLLDEEPLIDLLEDGVAAARALATADPVVPGATGEAPLAQARQGGDEAFYVIDFAAQQYMPDGSSVTLTHTLVRVMTKGAIDRFGETELSGSSRVLLARTIKQDGSVQVPSSVDGKDTLSMPGLAEGDFVELAYLDYTPPSALSRTRRVGTKFFFKMQDISSLRSEFVVINPGGEFLRRNDAPGVERFEYRGTPAVRFKRVNSPRPRAEPYAVGVEERLPWVQLLHTGTVADEDELNRLAYRELLRDAMKLSHLATQQLGGWIAQTAAIEDPALRAKALFYLATDASPSPSRSLSANLSHGLITREANPLHALLAMYRYLGIPAEVYLAKSKLADPTPHPQQEISSYSEALLRVRLPGSTGQVAWLVPDSQDAMYNALPHTLLGQPAICITCEEPAREMLPTQNVRLDRRDQLIRAELDVSGTLRGTISQTYDGGSATFARTLLRERQEPNLRQKLVEALIADHVPGATVTAYTIEQAEARDEPITFVITFEREQFARTTGQGQLTLEANMFSQPLASTYTPLPSREATLIIARARDYKDRFEITLPPNMAPALRSATGSRELKSPFGSSRRTVTLADQKLIVESQIDLGVQRVSPDQYGALQQWAIAVEQSSALSLSLTAPKTP